MEIYRFVPPALLKDVDLGGLELDEFIRFLAKARYIQERQAYITAKGIALAFGEE